MPEFPEVGDEFAGYLLRSVIGRGTVSVVYEAEHPRIGHGIALKVLAAELGADHVFRTRFLEESRIAAALNHAHMVPVYDVGSSDGLLYVAMHRASGDLRQKIAKGGPLAPPTAVALLSQATRALDAAHRLGLVHRDVKPENLLIDPGDPGDEAGAERLYLADFGISKLGMERNGLTATGRFLGTRDYIAPEQISEPYVYGSADQFALGCVLYECLTGRVPFDRDVNGHALGLAPKTGLSPAVDEMFARVLARRPGDRYNTCREFMEAAGVALAGLAPTPASASAPGRDAFTAGPGPDGQSVPAPNGRPVTASGRPAPVGSQREAALTTAVPRPGPSAAPDPADLASAPADSGPGSGGNRSRARWLAIAAVLLLVGVGGVVGGFALSSHPKAAAATPTPTPTLTPTMSMTPHRAPVNPLTQVLTAANDSKVAMGMLPPSRCQQRSETTVVCTDPSPSISRATFITYPSLRALFAAYKAEIRRLNHGRYRENSQDCGLSAPNPYGEATWNHQEKHSHAYTIGEMTSGKVPVTTAMGRMACLLTAHRSEDIVWTTDYGRMLGIAIGHGSHTGVWLWWIAVHHNIVFPGTPMGMGDNSVTLMNGAPTGSPSPSMMSSSMSTPAAAPAPSMSNAMGSATASPSMPKTAG